MPESSNTRIAMFQGTRRECMAWLDSYFSIQKNIVEGARSSAVERGEDVDGYDRMLDTLSREVYEVSVTPLGMEAETETRPENAYRAMRIQTALELFDALANDGKNIVDDKHDS